MDETLKTEKLFYDQVQKLSEHTILGVAGSLINSIIMVIILWGVVNRTHLLLWVLCVMLISIIRMNLQHGYKKIDKNKMAISKWKNVFLITLAISGLIWGSAAVALFPPDSIGHQSFIAFVLGGMVAGSVGVYSVVLTAFLAFSLPVLLPITLRFFLTGGQIHLAMGTMLFLFWLIMFMTARKLHKDILNYFYLKYENKDLILELEAEINVRNIAESELKKKNLEIEKIVYQRTSELQETNRKLTDEIEERRSIANALRESEEKYRDLVEDINDVIFSTDQNGIVTYISPAVKSSLGYDPQEIIGESFVNYIHEDDHTMVLENFAGILAGQINPTEYRIRTKTNEYRWVRSSSRVIMKEDQIAGIRGSFTDITEKKKLEEELRQSAKMESIGRLAGGIAHDFNNILGIIVGNTELAMDDVPEWNPARDNLKEIRIAAMRARDVVKQILSFSRKSPHEMKPVRISSIVKESLKLLRSSIPMTIEIQQDISSELDTVRADPTQINQVLINLCTNAAHAMRNKGGVLEVALENVTLNEDTLNDYNDLAPGKYVKLTVSDTGQGMDPRVVERIFEPYFTTKAVGEGSGLGLAVVHGIVKSHGGDILANSEPEKGTTMHVLFPVIEREPEPEIQIVADVPLGNEKILLVDDEKSIIDVMQPMLKRLGYQVAARTSSIEALEAFRAKPDKYDLVITDFTMSNMTGMELAEKLLKLRPDIPIILCTGFSERINENKAKSRGIRAFVMKPVVRDEIANIIRMVLDKK